MTLQLCPVLEYLHSRQPPITFRDLKPSNIMRLPAGSLCLIDFGIAPHDLPPQARGYPTPWLTRLRRSGTIWSGSDYPTVRDPQPGCPLALPAFRSGPLGQVAVLASLAPQRPTRERTTGGTVPLRSRAQSERAARYQYGEVAPHSEAISQGLARYPGSAAPLWQTAFFHMLHTEPSSADSSHSLHQPMYPASLIAFCQTSHHLVRCS